MIKFCLRKIYHANLIEAISLAEIDASLKVTSVSTNEIASFRYARRIFLKRKLIFTTTKTINNLSRIKKTFLLDRSKNLSQS